MLKNVDWAEDRAYRTGGDNEPLQFYLDALSNSTHFDLLLGYFSSSAISVLSPGFAKFLSSGGTIRMILNDILSEEDRSAIQKGLKGESGFNYDINDIRELKNILDEYGRHFFECLAWLVENKKLQIKIIKPKKGNGISHYKSGIFSNGSDCVGFRASCNFTAYGLLENLEELDSYLSWENGRSQKWIEGQRKYFEEIFFKEAQFVEYVDIENVQIAIKTEFGGKDINELLIQEKELLEKKRNIKNKKLVKAIQKKEKEIEAFLLAPRFPYQSGPRNYQITAFNNWKSNGYKGIFAMATGTGKTITALNCVLEQYHEFKSYKAIILVPNVGLANQWEQECKQFNFQNIIKINSAIDWQAQLALLSTLKSFFDTSYIIIVTYASFYRARFQEFFKKLDANTILIGDEVHNMGSPTIARLLPEIHLNKRIGLSATPKRLYDEVGGAALEAFFDDRAPYVFNYSMKEAIENGVLCPYLYFPHIIELTQIEFQEYEIISKQLAKFFDNNTSQYEDDSIVEILLLKRKRIIHKAENKKIEFKKIVKEEFEKRGTLQYTLVYVPEGHEPDYSKTDITDEDEEDARIINQFTKIVSEVDRSVMVKQFTSSSEDRNKIIKDYSEGRIHVLTSMKCLDEGIDVPRSEYAIFCASTGNPRQFIQRRGRILRKHKAKTYATIHDLVVIPKRSDSNATFQMERSLVQKELERVVSFSSLADNKTFTYQVFKNILDEYNINLNDFEI